MNANRIEYQIWAIQSLSKVNPDKTHQIWSDVAQWAVPGYQRWKNHEHRVHVLGEKNYGDMLAFSDRETALLALQHARIDPCHPHPYGQHFGTPGGLIDRLKYRVVERYVLMTQRNVEVPIKVWTAAYRPFRMGGDPHAPIMAEADAEGPYEAGRGVSVYVVRSPLTQQIYIAEEETGAFIGDSLEQVRADIAATTEDVIAAQRVDARAMRARADLISAARFWDMMKRAKD